MDGDEEETLPRQKTYDPENVREIIPDVTGTKYAGAERAVDWEDLITVA